ncbi:protein unc-45 homolog B-like [Temnothorax americanus]|uniref:protein unc-45 homolog B-like n=1 Tax=Temnothorax americanus TaxID=1964332 RepID=UPI0040675EC9
MAESDTTAQEWKKKGDEEFNKGNWSEVLSHYTKAIELATDDTEKRLYYDNRAAAYFEQGNYDEAIEDCNSVLKICPDVPITLFRRFLALIELERYEEAFEKDADEKIISSYTNDTSCSNNSLHQHTAKQFRDISDKYIKEKVSQMMGLAFNVSADQEKRENAVITLLRLARWKTDAYEIFIKEVGENDEAICSAIRIVAELCNNNVSRTNNKSTMINVVLPWCLEMMNSTSTERVNASQYCLQNILNIYTGTNDEPVSKLDETLYAALVKHEKDIDTFLSSLLDKIGNETTTGIARDTLINLITCNIHHAALDWAKRLVEFGGLQTLMEMASEMVEFKNESSIDITSSTQTLISMCLTKIYKKMYDDGDKATFIKAIEEFIEDKLPNFDTKSKVRIVLAITTLIFGPLDVEKIESIRINVLPWCLEMMNSTSSEIVNASQYCLQSILNTCCGRNEEPDSIPDETLCKEHKQVTDTILSCLLDKIDNKTLTPGIARDASIEFITRNIHYTALGWAKRMIEFGGLGTLIELTSQLVEYQYQSSFDITSSTRTITRECLAKIDENLPLDYRQQLSAGINRFVRNRLYSLDEEPKLRAIVAMTTLTFGPFNVANTFITEDRFNDIIDSDDSEDLDNFENLDNSEGSHDSENLKDSIRIRAFVGICKMTKFDELERELQAVPTFNKEQIGTWLKICIRFLTNPQRNMRKWAIEGLSYLTVDLGVKDDLIGDKRAVKAIIEFAKIENQSILYQVNILLVNLCIAYDNFNFPSEREMFVKCFNIDHVQTEDDYVQERRRALAEAGVTSALVGLAKTGSENNKELIARVFNAICSQHDLRKIVVQEGGTEALLSLALNGTDTGMIYATRALAYLAHTTSPEVAFPGQIIMEVVQPISNLLNPERSVNERCDALTALCNLASVNNMREHIFKTEYEKIELCMRDDNNLLLKRTSTQLINNLVLCRDVAIQLVKQRSDQLFDLINRSVKDGTDDHTKKAIAGTLATLTAASEEACEKLLGWDIWSTFLPILLNDPDDNLQHKGTEIALNMMNSTKYVAAKLIETDTIMKRVRELSDNNTMQNKKIKELASRVLEAAVKWGKLKRNIEESGSSQSTDNIEHSIKKIKRE